MNPRLTSNVSTIALIMLTGCGEAVDVVASSDGRAPTTKESPATSGSDSPSTSLLSVSGFTNDGDGAALPAVKVCLQSGVALAMDVGECVTSAFDGSFSLHGVPGNMLVTIGFEKGGFVPTIRAIQMGDTTSKCRRTRIE